MIDGGSTDNTLAIIDEYKDQIDILISEPDQGISDAFNKGINLATGDYIAIINADDDYDPDIFGQILSAAEQQRSPGVIHGNLRYIGGDGLNYVEKPDIDNIWRYMSVFHPTMFIHREIYKIAGNYRLDYRYAMDSEWVHRALTHKACFTYLPMVISNMRLGGTSHHFMHRSLNEFRRSTIAHSGNRVTATYYFYRQLLVQNLININWIKHAALWRRKLLKT